MLDCLPHLCPPLSFQSPLACLAVLLNRVHAAVVYWCAEQRSDKDASGKAWRRAEAHPLSGARRVYAVDNRGIL